MSILSPEDVARVAQLTLAAKEASLGALAGIHSAKRRGTSVEFAEHKEYAPGDDVRRIDWRAFARFDRYYLKQFQDEANLKVSIVFDASGSMGYKNKLAYARTLAAGIAHLALSQRDSVGLLLLCNGAYEHLPARTRSSHFEEVVAHLVRTEPGGEAKLADQLAHLGELLRGRGLVVVVSDMLDKDTTRSLEAIELLSARGLEVSLLHVQHPDERDFPFETPAFFASMEDARKTFVQPRLLKKIFVQEMAKHRDAIARRLRGARIDHELAWTDTSAADTLGAFLARRMHLLRVRG